MNDEQLISSCSVLQPSVWSIPMLCLVQNHSSSLYRVSQYVVQLSMVVLEDEKPILSNHLEEPWFRREIVWIFTYCDKSKITEKSRNQKVFGFSLKHPVGLCMLVLCSLNIFHILLFHCQCERSSYYFTLTVYRQFSCWLGGLLCWAVCVGVSGENNTLSVWLIWFQTEYRIDQKLCRFIETHWFSLNRIFCGVETWQSMSNG